jgi:hypothetical protein
MSARDKLRAELTVTESKLAAWDVAVRLWAIQCDFVAIN